MKEFATTRTPESLRRKYEAFAATSAGRARTGEPVRFDFGTRMDTAVYFANPSAPFTEGGRTLLCVRCCTARETDDVSVFVERHPDNVWRPVEGAVEIPLQDPNIAFIGGELVVSGVRAWHDAAGNWQWVCEFYRGTDVYDLRPFFTGPHHMKDIRLTQLADGRVGIFSRPQGTAYRDRTGRLADIGFTTADSLDDLDAAAIAAAQPLRDVFAADEWGGVNHVYPLPGGLLGVLCHLARGDGPFREGLPIHYYGAAFVFDPDTRAFTDPRIIVTRDNFGTRGDPGRHGYDVIFSAGLEFYPDGKALFYGGVSDSYVGTIGIDDPFSDWRGRV